MEEEEAVVVVLQEGDKKMKKYIFKLFLIVTVVFSLTGCYTIMWSPDEQLPSSENNNQIYYSEPYYGDYGYYYDYPWWLTGTPAYVTPSESHSTERNSGNSSVRDNNGSRYTPAERPIVNTKSPTRDSNSGNNNDSSGSVSKTSSTNNSGEQTRTSESPRSNDGNNSARNNNGSRNSGNGRK